MKGLTAAEKLALFRIQGAAGETITLQGNEWRTAFMFGTRVSTVQVKSLVRLKLAEYRSPTCIGLTEAGRTACRTHAPEYEELVRAEHLARQKKTSGRKSAALRRQMIDRATAKQADQRRAQRRAPAIAEAADLSPSFARRMPYVD